MESNLGKDNTPTKMVILEKDFGLMESARNGSTTELILLTNVLGLF